jgi:exopolysaccharide biosynthesis protein
MGNFINNLIDNLISTMWRLMDLPLYALMLMMVLALIVFNWLGKKWLKRLSDQWRLYINAILILLMLLFVVDKKFGFIRAELNVLNEKVRNAQMRGVTVAGGEPFELSNISEAFPNAKLSERPINEAIQLLMVTQKDPNSVVYIARVDMSHPSVQVEITPEKREKYLTSKFAKAHDCVLAINGEAGETMAADCELGEWSGNWVSKGNVVMMVDTEKRPFIGFDKMNNATYYEEKFVDTEYKDAYYNAIWGRFDILKDGELVLHDRDLPYARTVMGLSEDGEFLYLMIVDGKRPSYSIGLTYEDCAKMLRALGASDAMACDQGGSSCMYVENMGGIINRPADSDGIERPIYSHFGISMK